MPEESPSLPTSRQTATHKQPWTLGLLLLLCSSLTVLAGAIMTPSLRAIQKHFAEDHAQVELLTKLILTFPAIAIALTAPFAGWLADRFGRLRLLIGGLFFYALAGTTGLWLDDLYLILLGRLALGLAVAAIMTACTTLIADYYQGSQRTRFMGFQSAAMALGGMLYLMIGGVLATITWRGPFGVYLVSILILPFVMLLMKEPDHQLETQDQETDQSTAIPWAEIILVNALAFAGMLIFYLIPTDIDHYLESRFGHSPLFTAISMSVMTVAGTTISLLYFKLHRWLNYNLLSVMMFGFMGLGIILLGLSTQRWMVLGSQLVSGLGVGMIMANCNVWISQLAPLSSRGRFIGVLTAFIFLGQFASPAFSSPIHHFFGHGGWTGMYALGGALSISMAGLMLLRHFLTKPQVADQSPDHIANG